MKAPGEDLTEEEVLSFLEGKIAKWQMPKGVEPLRVQNSRRVSTSATLAPMNPTTLRLSTGVAAIVLVVSACGTDGPDQSGGAESVEESTEVTLLPTENTGAGERGSEANGETVDVAALDNTFRPETVEIVAGTEIRWENRGRNVHDVLPADETLQWGVDAAGFAPGDVYTLLFDTPGEYPYFCSIHGTKDVGMVGTIVVLPV